jgi:hypothetical protein
MLKLWRSNGAVKDVARIVKFGGKWQRRKLFDFSTYICLTGTMYAITTIALAYAGYRLAES